MKTFFLFLIAILCSPTLFAQQWRVEAEPGGTVTWSEDSVTDIHAPKGLTLWNTHRMKGKHIVIEYEARIVSDGRVSDLNCFWMASDPEAEDVFVNLEKRGGVFLNSYSLQLYYLGYGGNHNSTTRFRRYDGDKRGITSADYRPAIITEYLDSAHLLKPDHWYKIRLEVKGKRVRYYIDGERLVNYKDAHPLHEGHFGFRTTLAHAQLRNFQYRE